MVNVRSTYVLRLKQAEAAVICGLSISAMTKLNTSDDPPPRDEQGLYPSDELGRWIRRHEFKKMGAQGGGVKGGALLPVQEKARKDKEMADKYAMENKVRSAQLLELETVTNAAFDMVFRVKARLLRIPAVAANLLTGITDRVEIQEIIETEIRDALDEMSTDWTKTADDAEVE